MSGPATPFWPRCRRCLLGGLVATAMALPLLTACGVSVGSEDETTELFKRLTVAGDFHAGGILTMTLEYEQPYPVTVDVTCELLFRDFLGEPTPVPTPGPAPTEPIPIIEPTPANRVLDILAEALPRNANGGPVDEATPISGTIERDFPAPEVPGRYTVRCLTPRDRDNRISQRITIEPAAAGDAPTEQR
jgi:hypothetical protein